MTSQAESATDRHSNNFRQTMSYRPALDGLRGVAVCLVGLFHAEIPGFSGGYVGVDVFFVASGFLIASILSFSLDHGKINLIKFLENRARRLLPALIATILVTLSAFYISMHPSKYIELGKAAALSLASVSNFFYAANIGYFDANYNYRPLLHTWSLGVEVQFYLVAVGAAALAGAGWSRNIIVTIFTFTAASSLGVSVYLTWFAPTFGYFMPVTRMWEFALGAAVAFASARFPGLFRWPPRMLPAVPQLQKAELSFAPELCCAAGLALVFISAHNYDASTAFPGYRALAPALGAALVIWAIEGDSKLAQILSWTPITAIGAISYGFYLFHWPALLFARSLIVGSLSIPMALFVLGIALALAWLSYRYFENPIRRRTVFSTRRSFALALASGAFAVLALSGAIIVKEGWPHRFPAIDTSGYAIPRQSECFDDESIGTIRFCRIGNQSAPATFIVIGDSHTLNVLPALDRLASARKIGGLFAGTSGCPPSVGLLATRPPNSQERCRLMTVRALERAREELVDRVLLVARWSYYTNIDPISGYRQTIFDPDARDFSLDGARDALFRGLRETVEAFSERGVESFALLQAPQHPYSAPEVMTKAKIIGVSPESYSTDRTSHRAFQSVPTRLLQAVPDLSLIDPEPAFCVPNGECRQFEGETPLYLDRDHLNRLGSARLTAILEPFLEGLATRPE